MRSGRVARWGVGLLLTALAASAWWGWRETRPPIDPAAEPFPRQAALAPDDGPRIRVEVLNGTGESGVAKEASDRLRAAGFDVVYYGNAESFDVPATFVVDRIGSGPAADSVAAWLGVADVDVEPELTLHLDATIVLGDDWRQRLVRSEAPEIPEQR